MNEQDKSLELAKLMGWRAGDNMGQTHLQPYDNSIIGLAQFATILLKFPEVLSQYDCRVLHNPRNTMWKDGVKPSQENMLDAILKMNGIRI